MSFNVASFGRIRLIKRFLLFLLLWFILTGGAVDGIAFGIAAASGAAFLSGRLAPPRERPLRLMRLLALVPGFLRQSFAGGLDVAWRAFHPRLPLRPGWVSHPTKLPGGTLRVLLGGEMSLLPGTIAAGVQKDCLLVHCLDTNLPVRRQFSEEEAKLRGAVLDD